MLWGRYASRASEARYPQLWQGRVFGACPSVQGPAGLNLYDLSGRGRHGTLTNMDAATDWVRRAGRYALDFDGSNDRVLMPSAPVTGAGFTISAWVNIATLTGDKTVVTLFSAGTQRFMLYVTSDRRGAFFVNDSGGFAQALTAIAVTVNTWVHLAAVEASPSNHQVIVNASTQDTVTTLRTPSGITGLQIGADSSNGTSGGFMNGAIDDVAIYNRVLTRGEIRLLATRRGIAYEARRDIFGTEAAFKAYWARRQSQVIGGGV